MMHGIGFFNSSESHHPWGTKWLGHLANQGGLYNTFRIPYGNYIRVTLESKTTGDNVVENYRVVVGDLALPANARMRLQRIDSVLFPVYEFVELAHSKKNGMLFMVTLAGKSIDFNYLEGCFRLCVGNNTDVQYLSSGTEDFFLSAYYYNEGVYHTDMAGLTYIKKPGTMSAYKFFERDPVLFNGSFHLIWRQSEVRYN